MKRAEKDFGLWDEAALERETEIRLSDASYEIIISHARSKATADEIARLKTETRSVLDQIEANLKQHVA